MAFPTFNPPVAPSPGTKKAQTVNLLKSEFGDGYTQAVRSGYNHMRRRLELSWEALTREQRNQIVSFFEEMGGDRTFYYQHYDESEPTKWTCEEWESANPDGVYTVRAILIESFQFDS